MALINCSGCGHLVSDKAKACPHCGAPVETNGAPDNATPETQNATSEAPVVHYVKPERKNNNILIALIVMGVVALLGICGWLWYDNQQKRAELERQLAEQAEQARQDSIAAAELREQLRQDSIAKAKKQEQIDNIYNEYVAIIKQFKNDEFNRFFLFDITQDGIPELWITGTHPNNYGSEDIGQYIYVYSIQNQRAKLIDKGGWCSPHFYQGKDYIVVEDGCYEDYGQSKATYKNGKIVYTTIYLDENYDYEKPHPKITEPKITEYRTRDFESLKRQIQSYFQD